MLYKGNNLNEITFPLGGIGTGSIGIDGSGRFKDWEIFNKPSKGSINGYSHFAIRAIQGDKITAKVLNGDITNEYMGQYLKSEFIGFGYGPNLKKMCGFPHFKEIEFDGEFPMATIKFSDEKFPGKVIMTAFNPMIPCDAKNSSIPAAFFEIEVENTTEECIKYQIALSLANPYPKSINKGNNKSGFSYLSFYNAGVDINDVNYGDLTIATDSKITSTQAYWYRGGWQDSIVTFWNEFSSENVVHNREYNSEGWHDTGTLMAEVDVNAYEKKNVKFIISWNVPNNFNYWNTGGGEENSKSWKNYYATVFEDSVHTATYSLENWEGLYNRTLKFKNSLHGTTMPEEIIDAVASNLSVLKSPTTLRLEDGSFYGWEGVSMYGTTHMQCVFYSLSLNVL